MQSPIIENIMIIVVVAVCVLGPAFVIGTVGYAAVIALGRNPSASPKILTAMLVAFLYAEAIALVALLVAFQLFT